MKQLIIFLLVIILGIISYGQYKKHERFSLENYEYNKSDKIDNNYHDKILVYNYYQAIEDVNNYIISKWSANNIDVRNPKKDNAQTQLALKKYTEKLGHLKYIESVLEASKALKDKGLSNNEIKHIEQEGVTLEDFKRAKEKEKLIALFKASEKIKLGSKSPMVYQIQKLLLKQGYDYVLLDGLYAKITAKAVKAFETKHNLYADGIMDIMTFEALIK